jgi:hypothetical protein
MGIVIPTNMTCQKAQLNREKYEKYREASEKEAQIKAAMKNGSHNGKQDDTFK